MTNANPVYSFCLVLLMAGFFLFSCTQTKSPTRVFKTESLSTQPDKVTVFSHEDAIFEIRGKTGFGKGAIELVEGEWPEFCTVRLFLKGLEGFNLIIEDKLYDKYDLEVSTPSEIDKDWFEVKIYRSLLPEGTKKIDFNWVDFYR